MLRNMTRSILPNNSTSARIRTTRKIPISLFFISNHPFRRYILQIMYSSALFLIPQPQAAAIHHPGILQLILLQAAALEQALFPFSRHCGRKDHAHLVNQMFSLEAAVQRSAAFQKQQLDTEQASQLFQHKSAVILRFLRRKICYSFSLIS